MSGKAWRSDILRQKNVFIAGGTSGINLAIAQSMIDLGACVSVISRTKSKVDAAIRTLSNSGGEAAGFVADVRDYDAVEKSLYRCSERFGPIDCLISGAAGNFLAPATKLSSNGFRTVVEIDLIGTFNVFRGSWEYLRKRGEGADLGASLIAISAGQAVNPMAMQSHACAAKAGVNMLVKCLALEWGPAGVRVNAISPGPIANTEGMSRLAPTSKVERDMKARLALRDFGQTEDVNAMAIFLASDEARYVTGSIFNVDGGNDLGDASIDCV